MRPSFRAVSMALSLVLLGCLGTRTASGFAIQVVDIIPNFLSGETERDSEPNIAVNPANPLQMAASAFTPDPLGSGSGPVFISMDGGATWLLNVILPGGNNAIDVTLRFADTSNILYAGVLHREDDNSMEILRKDKILAPGPAEVLLHRANEDQPYTQAATAKSGPSAGHDRVYVGHNDLNAADGKTATIEQSLDVGTAPLVPVRIEARPTCRKDGPSIRPVVHADGTVYAAFFRWTDCRLGAISNTADVVVVRDDHWGSGAAPYNALTECGLAGVRVTAGVTIIGLGIPILGAQREGSNISIAVDPRNSRTVYLAWADGVRETYSIHLRRSTDGGAHWSGDLRTIPRALNPSIAVNSGGRVGFLYQQYVERPSLPPRWETHLERSDDGSGTINMILASVPDDSGSYTGPNPIGDYNHLMAVGADFYGIFSGNNTPDKKNNFPQDVVYLRNVDWAGPMLRDLKGKPVQASIDPFFFHATASEP